MKKLRVNLKHSAFYGCEVKLSFRSIKHIDQAETPMSCSCEQKLIGPEMTQTVGSHSSVLTYVNLDHM